jgi:hypothetical protein
MLPGLMSVGVGTGGRVWAKATAADKDIVAARVMSLVIFMVSV